MIASKHSIDDIQLIGGADVMAGECGVNQTEHKMDSICVRVWVCVCARGCFHRETLELCRLLLPRSALLLKPIKKAQRLHGVSEF